MTLKTLFVNINIVLLLSFHLNTIAQVKVTKSIAPKKIKAPVSVAKVNPGAGPIIKILENGDEGIPLAFLWQLNADTLLKKGDVFREMISFPGNAVLNRFMADDSITLQKSSEEDYAVTRRFVSFSGEDTTFNIIEDKGMLVLENVETHKTKRYKVVLDKARKKILKLQDTITGRIYLPTPFEGGSVSG